MNYGNFINILLSLFRFTKPNPTDVWVKEPLDFYSECPSCSAKNKIDHESVKNKKVYCGNPKCYHELELVSIGSSLDYETEYIYPIYGQ